MQATVQIKNVYGNETIYPVDDTAKRIAHLAGTKTLTRQTINIAKALGFEFVVQQQEVL